MNKTNVIPMFGLAGIKDALVVIEPPQQYLSFKDLDKVVGFKSAKSTNNKAEIARILFENGADITKPYKLENCEHRLRTEPNAYKGLRFVFTERVDQLWKLSGACSMEAYVHTKDKSLEEELINLDPRAARNRDREDEYIDINARMVEGDCI